MTNFFLLDEDMKPPKATDNVLFRTPTEFSLFITTLARENEDTITNTLLQYCEDRDVDPSDIAKLINKPLKELLAKEMQESGLLQRASSATFE